MPCYYPLNAWISKGNNREGKKTVKFQYPTGYEDQYESSSLPCGRCIGCRLERSRQWAIRCMHEHQIQKENGKDSAFITLTYNNDTIPLDGGLNKKHFQDFMKRLRKRFPDDNIRYLHCGEYGSQNNRPHYHAILFGISFPDLQFFKFSGDFKLFTSETLDSCWKKGYCWIGGVTFESAAYVARYITKKLTLPERIDSKEKAEIEKRYYEKYLDKETGVLRQNEYITMSRRPGIGKEWLDKYHEDVYSRDQVIIHGINKVIRGKPPKYYDNKFDIIDPIEYEKIKERRKIESKENQDDYHRLVRKEHALKIKFNRLERTLENG